MKINAKDLIPKDKHDIQRAENLKNYSYSELKPIIPELLEWLQDFNWPVAKPISEYLKSINENISQEILAILKTNDGVWKYWIISIFGKITNDNFFRNEIIRIATNPTKDEVAEEVDKIADEIIIERGWK
ncbi:DUF5071 domain-containing protein [Flavobacterium sp. LS1R47]|uniref:DUF5071 domain-containing protein n=1 Tax=Flavobacterium frigoritolerans TaxID=2987686 RepID=A0A9X3C0F4_9FLAO|nr:DUF5071 domain-containing protein [Flavobacterium frigoritolerans]MCV9930701.1 DUF5071 domain-containing protein [Flavobacterium frigoritolerans]